MKRTTVTMCLEDYLYNETRYTMLRQSHPEEAKKLLEEAREDVAARWKIYETRASMSVKVRDNKKVISSQTHFG